MPVISVRGSAQLEVAPDSALLALVVSARAPSRESVLFSLTSGVRHVVDSLGRLGGVPVTPDSRTALTYARRAVSVDRPRRWDDQTGSEVPDGPLLGEAPVHVQVRDWGLLDPVVRIGPAHAGDQLALRATTWHVDPDNPGWARVRAMAVHDAATRAGHYAAALGVELGALEHLADAGLLDGDTGRSGRMSSDPAAEASFTAGGRFVQGDEVVRLDPEPQTLWAQVEARYSAAP